MIVFWIIVLVIGAYWCIFLIHRRFSNEKHGFSIWCEQCWVNICDKQTHQKNGFARTYTTRRSKSSKFEIIKKWDERCLKKRTRQQKTNWKIWKMMRKCQWNDLDKTAHGKHIAGTWERKKPCWYAQYWYKPVCLPNGFLDFLLLFVSF